jgi:hypothetical protein
VVKRKRDFQAEYRRRVERALARGLSKAQARGHRRATEAKTTKNRAEKALDDAKLQMGLRFLRKEKSFTKAAKEAHISPERLRTIAIEKGIVEKRGRRWVIKHELPRRVLIFTDGREKKITVGDFSEASLVGKYMSAVGWFLRTNDIRHLRPYASKSVTDIDDTQYPLETRPNTLHRLANAGVSSFEQVYRIVV